MSVRSKRSKASRLLSDFENDTVFNILGNGCVSLSTAVVQLFKADPPDVNKWTKRCCGVVCFIKDYHMRSYFFRIYSLQVKSMVWEQELYSQFEYKVKLDFFHTFEADDAVAGLNFASEEEAGHFEKVVQQKLKERADKKAEKRQTRMARSATIPRKPGPTLGASANKNPFEVNLSKKQAVGSRAAKPGRGGKLTKDDISKPTGFQHVGHLGWDPKKGFDAYNVDEDMKKLLESVGVEETNTEAVELIYAFVDEHGGLDMVKNEMAKRPAAPPPDLPPRQFGQPPPPPERLPPGSHTSRDQPSKLPHLPGQKSRPPGKAPPPPPKTGHTGSSGACPPPPPPPPPVGFQVSSPNRTGLQDELNQQPQSKPEEKSGRAPTSGNMTGDLLQAIRNKTTLKPVDTTENTENSSGGLVDNLRKILVERYDQVHGSDEDEDMDVDDDWSD